MDITQGQRRAQLHTLATTTFGRERIADIFRRLGLGRGANPSPSIDAMIAAILAAQYPEAYLAHTAQLQHGAGPSL